MSCSQLTGGAVLDGNDAEVGHIDHLLIEMPTGRIAYAVLTRGGVYGIGGTLTQVAWSRLRVDSERGVLVLGVR